METANKNLLRSLIEELNKYAVRDSKYTTSDIPRTISKFGPSGSLKNTNNTLEHKIAVTAKIMNVVVFDLKYMFVIILENARTEYAGLGYFYAIPHWPFQILSYIAGRNTLDIKTGRLVEWTKYKIYVE